jgi:hypothetical protein
MTGGVRVSLARGKMTARVTTPCGQVRGSGPREHVACWAAVLGQRLHVRELGQCATQAAGYAATGPACLTIWARPACWATAGARGCVQSRGVRGCDVQAELGWLLPRAALAFLFSLLFPFPFLFPKSKPIYSKASMCVYMCAMHIYILRG